MASQSLPAFLVFPSVAKVYVWRVKSTETNRTISRHKILKNAVNKAEKLNVEALSLASAVCQYQPADEEFPCGREAVITDLETEQDYCLKHYEVVCG